VTAWNGWRSPLSGACLHTDTPYSLSDGDQRWPVVEGIPFLRANRRALADAALELLDQGNVFEATVLLLADQDDWARTPPASDDSRRHLVRQAEVLSFRAAMDLLAFGPVATYFAHRWSDPTFLSGLALAEAHRTPGPIFELACGAGHFLREFDGEARSSQGLIQGSRTTGSAPAATGADIVFAKLWLARRYVAPSARLVCFDAAGPWPLPDAAFATVFCHDAFYFLPNKPHIAREMRRVATGPILIGHAHNALVDNLSAGSPLPPADYAALFGTPTLYDDRELTDALIDGRAPRSAGVEALATAPAISMAVAAAPARVIASGLAMPPPGAALRRNPLYDGMTIRWPSSRYETEYAALATYPAEATGPLEAIAGSDPAIDALARRRILLDLPEQW
jgi:hypothetical protein